MHGCLAIAPRGCKRGHEFHPVLGQCPYPMLLGAAGASGQDLPVARRTVARCGATRVVWPPVQLGGAWLAWLCDLLVGLASGGQWGSGGATSLVRTYTPKPNGFDDLALRLGLGCSVGA